MAQLVTCPKYNEFKWGDGSLWCSRTFLKAKYVALVEDNADAPYHRASVTIKHAAGSLFSVYSILPLVSAGSWNIEHRGAQVDQVFNDKISLIVKHTNGTLFRLDALRPQVSVMKRRLVS